MKQRLTHHLKQQECEQQQQQEVTHQHQQPPLEFSSAEEALRFDAAQTAVPRELRERVMQAIDAEPKQKPWWKRWL